MSHDCYDGCSALLWITILSSSFSEAAVDGLRLVRFLERVDLSEFCYTNCDVR